jgi:chaperone required for assembly of F1-ATPase
MCAIPLPCRAGKSDMADTAPKLKKFYRDVSVAVGDTGHRILLDGKPVRTPARQFLAAPSMPLAEAIAGEWRRQDTYIRPETMPLTKLANTAIDRVTAARAGVIAETVKLGESDLVCYRAEAPAELVARQSARWDPLLAWLSERFGASLQTTQGIGFVTQPKDALGALARAVDVYDDFALAGFSVAAALTGSLVVALALAEEELDAEAAFAAAELDEAYQAERWGRDAEAEARLAGLKAELMAAEQWLKLLRKS